MKDILHPKDEREPLVLKGEWWSPADATKTLSGTMNFEIDGDSDLELLGAFDQKNGHLSVLRTSGTIWHLCLNLSLQTSR